MKSDKFLQFIFVMHLPYVKKDSNKEGILEERWLFDALTWSYIPFIEMIKDLSDQESNFSVGICVSPTLLSMLNDETIINDFMEYLDDSIIFGYKEHKRLTHLPSEFNQNALELADWYRDHYLAIKDLFLVEYQNNLLGQLKLLEALPTVEMFTTCATYLFLPNFRNSKEMVSAQIKNGILCYKDLIGVEPKGFLFPECGYYEDLELELASNGIEYTFCDPRGISYADKVATNGIFNPVKSKGEILFFPRDNVLSSRVWSEQDGYMTNPLYRDFLRDVGTEVSMAYLSTTTRVPDVRMMTGYKYYSVGQDNETDGVYNRTAANEQVDADVENHVEYVKARLTKAEKLEISNPVCTQIFDVELFGQRWYEGIDWLEKFLVKIIRNTDINVCAPSRYLQKNFDANVLCEKIGLSFSSWSQKGYAQVWLNENNKQLNKDIFRAINLYKRILKYPAEEKNMGKDLNRRIIKQAGRELMLAQSSDWPFILSHNKFTNFALREVYNHLKNFNILCEMLVTKQIDFTFVYNLERQNRIFPNFDYAMFE